jgi:decaprenylphospho-beta-D-ribofuranose 2-oxidase
LKTDAWDERAAPTNLVARHQNRSKLPVGPMPYASEHARRCIRCCPRSVLDGRHMSVRLSGWGRYPWRATALQHSEALEAASAEARLARGLGRAYGDAALPASPDDVVLGTPRADRILHFDEHTGVLRAEAGLALGELYQLFLPRGFFTAVSPGTRHVTLGGMVAADIHGKNHHVAGTFGRHVRALRMRVGDGRVLECSRQQHADLFYATLGGMGLTGHILEVEAQLEAVASPWIYEESERCDNLEEVFASLREASAAWPMTVAWIDTSARGPQMGRGIVMRGRWANPDEGPSHSPTPNPRLRVPFDFPNRFVNPATIGVLNRAWFAKHPRRTIQHLVAPESFFWILDMVDDWNRVFGRNGFMQYQCVLPPDVGVFREFLTLFQRLGACSFVTVLKDCGEVGEGLLSFPKAGSTIAVDIPLNDEAHGQAMTDALNELVLAHAGRVYLAKDTFSRAEHIAAMYPRLAEWCDIRRRYDPEARIRSALGVRCGLCPPA